MDQAVFRAAIAHAAIDVAQSDRAPTLYQVVSPIVRTVLDSFNGALITPAEFCGRLKDTLGWYVPISVCDTIFQGFVDDGLGTLAGKGFQARPTTLRNAPVSDPYNLIAPIVTFIEGISPLYLPRQKADLLLEAAFNHVLFDGRLQDGGSPDQREAAYWVARYFAEEMRSSGKLGGLAWVKNLALTCSLIEYFAFASDVHPRAKGIEIYLDGPVLLDALGFGLAEAVAESREAIDALRGIGCKVRLFRHSIDEAVEIVQAVLRKASTDREGDVALALASGKLNESVLRQFVASPWLLTESTTKIKRIDIVDAGRVGEEDYFTEEDWSILYGRLSWYVSEPARVRDCDSVRAIMRLRGGVATTDPWESRALFITTNARLMGHAKAVCVQRQLIDDAHVGPMAARGALAGLLWMSGMQPAAEKLSMLEIARQAINVVSLRPEWLQAIEKSLDDIDQLDATLKQGFISSPAFARIAVDRVGGRTEQITPDIIREALATYEARIANKHIAERAAAERGERRVKDKVIESQRRRIENLRGQLSSARSEAASTREIEDDAARLAEVQLNLWFRTTRIAVMLACSLPLLLLGGVLLLAQGLFAKSLGALCFLLLGLWLIDAVRGRLSAVATSVAVRLHSALLPRWERWLDQILPKAIRPKFSLHVVPQGFWLARRSQDGQLF